MVISKQSLGHLTTAQSGIRWGHLNAGYHPPTEHPFAKMAYEGAKKLLSVYKASNQKEPFTLEMFAKGFALYGGSTNLIHSRFLLVCVLGFSFFLRISELQDIQIKHISFHNDHMDKNRPAAGRTHRLHFQNRIRNVSGVLDWNLFKHHRFKGRPQQLPGMSSSEDQTRAQCHRRTPLVVYTHQGQFCRITVTTLEWRVGKTWLRFAQAGLQWRLTMTSRIGKSGNTVYGRQIPAETHT